MYVLSIVVASLVACQDNSFFQSQSSDSDQNSASADAQGDGGLLGISSYALANDCQVTEDGNDPCTDDGDPIIIKDIKQYGGKFPAGITPHVIEEMVNPTVAQTPHVARLGSTVDTTNKTMVERTSVHPATSHRQLTRRTLNDRFDQRGIHANRHRKTFSQRAQSRRRVLDILMVIDSSGSMADEQAILARELPLLTSNYVNNEDWQIAVVNTEPGCAMRAGYPSPRVTSSRSHYQRLINVGAFGGTEYAVYNAVKGLRGQCGLGNWLRPNSTVAVIILTDEQHQCLGNCSPRYLTNHLQNIRPSNYGVYGLVAPGDTSWGAIFNYRGSVSNKRDYGNVLRNIGSNIQQVLAKSFPLDSLPDSNSLSVTVNGRNENRYTLNRQTILFNQGYVPAHGATVVANWTTGFRAFDYSWTLSSNPLGGRIISAIVTKSGQPSRTLTTNDYTLSGRTISLTSNRIEQLMPQGSRLTVNYKENISMRRDFPFSVPGGLAQMRSPVTVRVNNALQTAGTHYNLAGSTVRFRNPPPEGATITIGSFRYRTSDELSYSVPLHQQNPRRETSCLVGGRNISCTHSGGTVTIDNSDFRRGQQLTVKQHLQSASVGSPLHDNFIEDSVTLTTGGQSCRASNNELDIDGTTINLNSQLALNRCPAVNDMRSNDRYTVNYRYQTTKQDQFVFPENIYRNTRYKFELYIVEVNGQKLAPDKYQIDDRQINFVDTLPSNARVRAELWLLPAL